MTRNHSRKSARNTTTLLALAAAALMLVACSPHEAGMGDHVDAAVDRAGQAAAGLTRPLPILSAQQLEAKSREAGLDATITANIKAEFAADAPLNALHIQVETKEGLVSLSGKAPDASTRERATRLAATVKDVLSVDNKMVLPA